MIPPNLEKNIERLLSIAGNVSKLGVLLGGICILIYSIRIGHFPKDLSLADSLLFLMTAAGFGIVHGVTLVSVAALGVLFARPLQFLYGRIYLRAGLAAKGVRLTPDKLFPFHWLSVPGSAIACWLTWIFGRVHWYGYVTMPLAAVFMYVCLSAYAIINERIKAVNAEAMSRIQTKKDERPSRFDDIEWLQETQLGVLAVILSAPLIYTGFFREILDLGMSVAHVRINNATLYVKEPYSTLLPAALQSTKSSPPKDYTAFEGIPVLFTGFGKMTVVAYPKDGKTMKLEIPNDQVIIEGR